MKLVQKIEGWRNKRDMANYHIRKIADAIIFFVTFGVYEGRLGLLWLLREESE